VLASGNPSDIPNGGACAWQLPLDATCASHARSALSSAMTELAFAGATIDDGVLAVSELATNAHQQAERADAGVPATAPELWVWACSYPQLQLKATVFDGYRDVRPKLQRGHVLDEHGNGMGIVDAVSAGWGSHASRSRLAEWPVPGKAVWFSVPPPRRWPAPGRVAEPQSLARQLHALLTVLGVGDVIHKEGPDLSLVSVPCGLNIRVEPHGFMFNDLDGTPIRRSLLDLHDLAEFVIQRSAESAGPAWHEVLHDSGESRPKGSDRPSG
jgi:anti-sigma regulatory factor (Ser/Thr protein kinase)